MSTTHSKSFSLLALIGICGLLSGCGSSPKHWSESNVEKRNKVELVRLIHDVDFAATRQEGAALTGPGAAALDAFLVKNDVGHYDELSVDLPKAADTDALKANLAHRKALAAYLAGRGLKLADAVTPYGNEPRPGTVRLVVGRYVVTPPKCGDWSKPAGPDYQNTVSSNYGCATTSVLGMMVANPRDLIEGRKLAPASGATGADAIKTYYEGAGSSAMTMSGSQGASGASSASSGTANSGK